MSHTYKVPHVQRRNLPRSCYASCRAHDVGHIMHLGPAVSHALLRLPPPDFQTHSFLIKLPPHPPSSLPTIASSSSSSSNTGILYSSSSFE